LGGSTRLVVLSFVMHAGLLPGDQVDASNAEEKLNIL